MLWCLTFLKTLCPISKEDGRTRNKEGLREFGCCGDGKDPEAKAGDNNNQHGDKADLQLAQGHRKGRYLLASLGTFFVALSSAIYILDPAELITKKTIQISDGNYAYRIWRKPPIPAQLKIHIFNYTNTEAFLNGVENLRVNEIGPYVFNVFLHNQNVTFNDDNTVSYVPVRTVFEDPERTRGDLKNDFVIALNTPLLGVGSYVSNTSIFTKMAFSSVTSMMGMKPFLKMSVEEYLWGYEDALVKHANKFLPNIVNFDKLGYMDRIFDEGTNHLTMNLNSQPEIRSGGRVVKPMTLERFNGEAGLQKYGYDPDDVSTQRSCNTLQGVASDGIMFPRNIAENSTFLIYRNVFCRTMPIVFERAGLDKWGIPAYWFTFPVAAFDNGNPENSCFCRPERRVCFPNGLSDISPCYWNMPVAASYPHFLNMDTSQLKTVEGLNPTVEDHGTTVLIQQNLGIMLKAHTRIQVNVVMGDMSYSPALRRFKGMVLPVLWADYSFDELPTYLFLAAYLLVVALPIIQYCCMVVFGVVGVVLLTAFLVRTCLDTDDNHGRRPQREEEEHEFIAKYDKLPIISVVRKQHVLTYR